MSDLFGAPPPPAPAKRRAAAAPAMERGAVISDCGLYRYSLWRRWGTSGGVAMFIGLNPSTADAKHDDPTIRRCIEFARAWGYAALVMCNLFAWRATDPDDMMAAADPVGPDNDGYLLAEAQTAAVVVAAWGVHGTHLGRDRAVQALLPQLHFLRLTKDGHPGHPLYLPADLRPTAWQRLPAPAPAPEPPPAPAQAAPAPRGRLVTLADGRQVDTWSDDWRMECFARHLLALAPQARNEWMFDLLQRYGEEGVAPIRAAMDSVRESSYRAQRS